MEKNLKKTFKLITCILVFASCSKNDVSPEPNVCKPLLVKFDNDTYQYEFDNQGRFLKISHLDKPVFIKFTYNTPKLLVEAFENNLRTAYLNTLINEKGHIVKEEYMSGENTVTKNFEYNSDGIIIKAIITEIGPTYSYTEVADFLVINGNAITRTSAINVNGAKSESSAIYEYENTELISPVRNLLINGASVLLGMYGNTHKHLLKRVSETANGSTKIYNFSNEINTQGFLIKRVMSGAYSSTESYTFDCK